MAFYFFGKESPDTFSVIIGAGNGTNSYGPTLEYTNGSRDVYAILGCDNMWKTDSMGIPIYPPTTLPVIIHEFSHSFVNYLIYKNIDAFRESGEKIFSFVKKEMDNKQVYPSIDGMLCEALVRASVLKYAKDRNLENFFIKYLKEKDPNFDQSVFENQPLHDLLLHDLIQQEKVQGFFWIEELVAELDSYDKQRDIYPTLESYIPKLVEAYKIWAENIQTTPPSNE